MQRFLEVVKGTYLGKVCACNKLSEAYNIIICIANIFTSHYGWILYKILYNSLSNIYILVHVAMIRKGYTHLKLLR